MSEAKEAIIVSGVTKTFKLPHEKHSTLKQAVLNIHKSKSEKFVALKDISFSVKKGEFFGIVGRNGSGKSTLLKTIAGIYTPDQGQVQVNGSLVPFIELGVGFNQELTARDNVFLNGALLGFSRKEMSAMYDEIVEFAGLERFMDQKLKNFSSGMQVRLAFSIAVRVKSNIMLIDEVLAVGDEAFQRKCYRYFREVKYSGRTVIFVSHDMSAVREFCDRAILIHDGGLVAVDESSVVAEQYSKLNLVQIEKDLAKTKPDAIKTGTGEAKIVSVRTISASGKVQNTFKAREKIRVEIIAEAKDNLTDLTVGMVFEDTNRRPVFASNTPLLRAKIKDIKTGEKLKALFEVENIFTDGDYSISCAISNNKSKTAYTRIERAHDFYITGWEMKASLTHPKATVTVTYPEN